MIKTVTPYIEIPKNYGIVSPNLSRSAQPEQQSFSWLKKQGVTDIINLRTMIKPEIGFDEEGCVKNLQMSYHNIPSITATPNKNNVKIFLNLMNEIIQRNGKAHIHCKAGADRTGMYAFIFKELHNIGKRAENIQEWLNFGHNQKLYPNLISWALDFIRKVKKN